MSRPVRQDEIADRLHSFTSENYTFIGGINKGIALALATVAVLPMLADIFNWLHPDSSGDYWVRLGPWLASVSALLVSHVTWTRGVALTNGRANLLDTVIPLVMGLFEVALFAVLIDDPSDTVDTTFWHSWFFVFAGHALLASWLVSNRIRFHLRKDFELDDAHSSLPDDVSIWLKADQKGAFIFGTASLFIGLLLSCFIWEDIGAPWNAYIYSFLAILFGVFLLKPIYDADSQRRYTDYFVTTSKRPLLRYSDWRRTRNRE